jgi:SAM-dependent methyltransferase
MEEEAIRQMQAIETEHWWFVGRRSILSCVLYDLSLPRPARILEAGCGAGGNLEMLAKLGQVSAFEPHPFCLDHARSRGIGDVRPGQLPDDIPFERASFDLVAALDVIEHLADDHSGLVALRDMLRPAGRIVVTVPAFMSLWSEHDTRHHHYRRYTKLELAQAASSAGFEEVRCSYFNTILFPAIAGIRLIKNRLRHFSGNDDALPPWMLNRVLAKTFAAERYLIKWMRLPAGTSLLMTGKRAHKLSQ